MRIAVVMFAVTLVGPGPAVPPAAAQDGPLRIIAFGAHPDDCELRLAGTAAKWAALGHHVKFVSVTNGDIGHWPRPAGRWRAGAPPSRRRRPRSSASPPRCSTSTTASWSRRSRTAAPSPGSSATGRRTSCSAIARTTTTPITATVGLLVQDAAYMVTVPFFCPDTPALARNPVFLSYEDGSRPNPFRADIVVAIDDVIEKKLAAVDALASQFYEGGANGGPRWCRPTSRGRPSGRARCVNPSRVASSRLRRSIAPSSGSCTAPNAAMPSSLPRRSRSRVRTAAERRRDETAVSVFLDALVSRLRGPVNTEGGDAPGAQGARRAHTGSSAYLLHSGDPNPLWRRRRRRPSGQTRRA